MVCICSHRVGQVIGQVFKIWQGNRKITFQARKYTAWPHYEVQGFLRLLSVHIQQPPDDDPYWPGIGVRKAKQTCMQCYFAVCELCNFSIYWLGDNIVVVEYQKSFLCCNNSLSYLIPCLEAVTTNCGILPHKTRNSRLLSYLLFDFLKTKPFGFKQQ